MTRPAPHPLSISTLIRCLTVAVLLTSLTPPGASAGPVISEFLAANQSGLLDEDREPSDWIELHNPDPTPVQLGGWHLTDDPARLTLWRLPDRTLPPGGYLVLFASGKNRTPAEPAPLHTNFRLDAAGEYLALVQPDGRTIAAEFRPAFPPQEPDLSYGIPSSFGPRDLLAGAPVSWLIPTSAQELPANWAESASAAPPAPPWKTGAGLAIGFDATPATPADANLARVATATATQSSTGFGFPADLAIDGDPDSFTHTDATDPGSTWSLDLGAAYELSRIVLRNRNNCCQSRLRDITVTLLGPDGSSVVWSSGLLNPENTLDSPAVLSLDFADLNVDAPVARHIRVSRTPDPDLSGSGGVGNSDEAGVLSLGEVEVYGVSSLSFAPLIRTDLASAMRGIANSAFVRIPFVLEAPASVRRLELQLRYDDGVQVFLNGGLVTSLNAPAAPAWNSAAAQPRAKSDAFDFVPLDLEPTRPLWRPGTNWLAFQLLNASPDDDGDDDLLLDARLQPELDGAAPTFTAHLNRPTPGTANDAGWNLGPVADTKFNVDRGVVTNAFDLVITTATPGAEIRYTLDGTAPTATTGQVLTGPIRIDKTRVVRAAAFKPDHRPSNIDTHTYLFPADIAAQPSRPAGFPATWAAVSADYAMDPRITQNAAWAPRMTEALASLPSVSLVTANDNLFGSTAGIYANPERSGIAWERPVSLEWLDPAGRNAFQVDCGLRIQGGYFRQRTVTRKHSLRLLFKNQYGPGRLRQDLFREFGAAREFDTLVLRAGANDGYAWDAARDTEQFTRDEFGRRIFLAMGQPSGRGLFVHLYLNGLYWGLYNLAERPAEDFSATYLGGDPADWDAVNAGDVKNGSLQAWNAFLGGVRTVASLADYQKLKGLNPDGSPNPALPAYLDAPHYIDYMLVNLWGGNWDWPNKNFWFGRDRTGQAGGFKFYVWDFENTMGNNRDRSPLTMLAPRNDVAASWVGEPHDRLKRSSAEYRLEFADRIQRHFFGQGALAPDSLIPHYRALANAIEPAVIAETARWGDDHWNPPQDLTDWQRERDWLLATYLPQRTAVVLDQFRAQGLYPATPAPTFSPAGGTLSPGSSIQIAVAATELLYTTNGVDPRLPGGAVHPSALKATFADSPTPSANPNLVRSGHVWRYLADGSNPGPAWAGTDFADNTWNSGPSPLGYGDGDEATVVPFVDTNPAQAGTQRNPTTLFRTTFEAPNPAAFQRLQLTLTYDDAAAVHLNGQEIARSPNLAAGTALNAFASGASSDNAILSRTDLPTSLLRTGLNVVAVQIHQSDANSSDISFDLVLTGVPVGAMTHVLELAAPASPIVFKARARTGTDWSALTEVAFTSDTTPATALNLVISELQYRPSNPTNAAETAVSRDRDDFEFLELLNIADRTADLSGVRFSEGVLFDFPPGTLLAPGARLLLVSRRAAFEARHGSGLAVAGEYQGRLDNNGEELALTDASGRDIRRFRYSNRSPWPDADGTGYSLVLRQPESNPDHALAVNWRTSVGWGASPGTGDATRFAGQPLADADANSQADLLDYAFGGRLDDPVNGVVVALESSDAGGGLTNIRLTVSYPRNPAADDAPVILEYAASLSGPWRSGSGVFEDIREDRTAPGRTRITTQLLAPISDAPAGFVRLSVQAP